MGQRDRSPDNKSWRQLIQSDVDNEGFEYAFTGYDNYEWVDDDKFQDLRKRYIDAIQELKDYVGIDDE